MVDGNSSWNIMDIIFIIFSDQPSIFLLDLANKWCSLKLRLNILLIQKSGKSEAISIGSGINSTKMKFITYLLVFFKCWADN